MLCSLLAYFQFLHFLRLFFHTGIYSSNEWRRREDSSKSMRRLDSLETQENREKNKDVLVLRLRLQGHVYGTTLNPDKDP